MKVTRLTRVLRDDRGGGGEALEYALIVALLVLGAVLVIIAISGLGPADR